MSGIIGRPSEAVAPTYPVPPERVVSIEHPCIVRTFDNGLKSLGGEPQLKHVRSISASPIKIEDINR
jgi:general transcription factor 3C polypeptide 5 (transcription factor C subunit 1)